MRHSLHCILAVVVSALIAGSASGHGAVSQEVPVARLVANLTQYIKEHPNVADGYYRLGRVHTMALEAKLESVMAFDGTSPRPAEGYWARRRSTGGEKPVPSTPAEVRTHLEEALRLLNRAIAMRPTAANYRLTLASVLEAGEPLRGQVNAFGTCC